MHWFSRRSWRKAVVRCGVRLRIMSHHFGYEGRCAMPSNFDANYCYSLGFVAGGLLGKPPSITGLHVRSKCAMYKKCRTVEVCMLHYRATVRALLCARLSGQQPGERLHASCGTWTCTLRSGLQQVGCPALHGVPKASPCLPSLCFQQSESCALA